MLEIEYAHIVRQATGVNMYEVMVDWKYTVLLIRPGTDGSCFMMINDQMVTDGDIYLVSKGGVKVKFRPISFRGRRLYGEIYGRLLTDKPLVLQKSFLAAGGERVLV